MHEGQKNLIKENILRYLIEHLYEFCEQKKTHVTIDTMLWAAFYPLEQATSAGSDIKNNSVYEPIRTSWLQLQKLYNHPTIWQSTFGSNTPPLYDLRLGIFEVIIDLLHELDPKLHETTPILPDRSNKSGMDKIRALVSDYVNFTNSGTIQRYKLAHEINIERHHLNLQCEISLNGNIYASTNDYVPGDFSFLDLSFMTLSRSLKSHGHFKAAKFTNTNLNGSVITGIAMEGWDFTNCSMRGTNIADCSQEHLIFNHADIEGLYNGNNWLPDRRAKNFALASQSKETLKQFIHNTFADKRPIDYSSEPAEQVPLAASAPPQSQSFFQSTQAQAFERRLAILEAENNRLRQEVHTLSQQPEREEEKEEKEDRNESDEDESCRIM